MSYQKEESSSLLLRVGDDDHDEECNDDVVIVAAGSIIKDDRLPRKTTVTIGATMMIMMMMVYYHTSNNYKEQETKQQIFGASGIIVADIDSMVIVPTPAPTTSLGPSSKLPDDDDFHLFNLTGTVPIYISEYDDDQQKLTSYSTFCHPGKFTNVQIVSFENKFVLCIKNIDENALLEFGYAKDNLVNHPNYPLIKLNPGPPRTCDNEDEDEDEDEDDSSSGQKNYCGFRGKQNTTTFSSIVNSFSNEGVVAVNINEIFSYTTYCQVNNYTNVRIVGTDTSITCITSDQGGTISLTNGNGGDIVQVLADGNKSDSSCDFIANGTSSNSRLVKDSTKCGFDGVANTVYTNFPSDDNNFPSDDNDSNDDFYYN